MNLQNKSIVLNVVLAIVVVVLGVRLVSGVEGSVESQTQEQVVLNNIATRTSIRDYEARPVEKEKVEKMLRAAMAAPTAMNKQPWHFVVVDQRSVLDSLAGANPYAKMLLKAPLAIVVCGDMDTGCVGSNGESSACGSRYGARCRMDGCLSFRGSLQGDWCNTLAAR